MRRTLVHRVVQHAFRCVEVQEQERKALVIQKYWRSYAANRELRRRRWALRRARAKASAIQSVLDLPGNLVKAAVKFVAAFVWSFLRSFRIFRALVWFVVRLPRALYRATYSWEGCWGVTAAATLAARNRNPNAGSCTTPGLPHPTPCLRDAGHPRPRGGEPEPRQRRG